MCIFRFQKLDILYGCILDNGNADCELVLPLSSVKSTLDGVLGDIYRE